MYDRIRRVSIPIGFSNELQREREADVGGALRFQSLSGFPMSCNGTGEAGENPVCGVSIPIGFSNELQRSKSGMTGPRRAVSIPIGFSNELQPVPDHACRRHRWRFNPYRVFQ